MAIDKELIDKLLADYKGPKDLIGEHGLLKQLTKALVERAMQAELTHHLGYEKHDPAGRGSGKQYALNVAIANARDVLKFLSDERSKRISSTKAIVEHTVFEELTNLADVAPAIGA